MKQSFWLSWSKAAGIRAVRSMSQTALAALGTGAAFYRWTGKLWVLWR